VPVALTRRGGIPTLAPAHALTMGILTYLRKHGLAGAAALAFLLVSSFQALGARDASGGLWRGYAALVVSDSVPLERVVGPLAAGIGADRVVSALTSTVSVTTFDGREEVAVADLDRRLDSLDPRYDAYMRKLPSLFRSPGRAGSSHVLYLRCGSLPLLLRPRVSRLLRGLDAPWSLLGNAPALNLPSVAAAALFLGLVLAGARRSEDRATLALASLPWLLDCLLGGPADLLCFALVFPFCCGFLLEARSHWTARGRRGLAALVEPGPASSLASLGVAVAVACVPVALLGEARDMARVLAAVAADLLLLAAAVTWDLRRPPRSAHRVFVPVTFGRRLHRAAGIARAPRLPDPRLLLASARGLVATRTAQFVALALVVCLSAFLPTPSAPAGEASVPAPVRSGAGGVSWESIGSLWLVSATDELPSLADFVAHEAYQASLAWGGTYRPPARDERVLLASFRAAASGPGVERELRTVLQFTDHWLRETLRRPLPGSVGRLLASQGAAVRVRLSAATAAPARVAEAVRVAACAVVVVLFLFLGSHYLRPSLFAGRPGAAFYHKRHQEA
jgi:hypothetical protein